MRFPDDRDDEGDPGALDLPCPTCGEYTLRAEAHLRDVALDVAFPAPGTVTLAPRHHGAQVIAIACESCGDELDPEDDQTGDRVERYLDARVRLVADEVAGPDVPGWLGGG